MNDDDQTAITLPGPVLERFKRTKPFESVAHYEWLEHLLDVYEEVEGAADDPTWEQRDESVPYGPVVQAVQLMRDIENGSVGGSTTCTSLVARQQQKAAEARRVLQKALGENDGGDDA